MQKVPLVGITADGAPLVIRERRRRRASPEVGGRCRRLDEARGRRRARSTNSEMVFVGYGVVAPEFDWDDYKGVDVKGKTIVMLINDPPVPDPAMPHSSIRRPSAAAR